jgi:A/G-specific adenine glycosylase
MELGAAVCLPRLPLCRACPVAGFCATRGELTRAGLATRQKKQEIHYTLACRNGSVFLVERGKEASLMPGMWELPQIQGVTGTLQAWLTLRHSITVTDYVVRVVKRAPPRRISGKWVPRPRLRTLHLTGLARKILRAAEII